MHLGILFLIQHIVIPWWHTDGFYETTHINGHQVTSETTYAFVTHLKGSFRNQTKTLTLFHWSVFPIVYEIKLQPVPPSMLSETL